MNYLLYGPDTYRSRKKLKEIIAEYRRRAGSFLNLSRFDAAEDDLSGLRAAAAGGSLFDAKKLIVVERPLASPDSCELVASLLQDTASRSDTIVAAWEGAVEGEAKKLVAQLMPLAQKKQEFKTLSSAALTRWIRDEARERGIALGQEEAAELARSGMDSWGMVNDMEKMAVAAMSEPRAGYRGLGKPVTVFDLGDTFLTRPRDAVEILHALVLAGEEEMRILSYLAGYARTLLIVKSYAALGRVPAPEHRIHRYVLRKASGQSIRIPHGLLTALPRWFFETDVKIKTGLWEPGDALVALITGQASG